MKKRMISFLLVASVLLSLLPRMELGVKATEPQKGDGWGNWSDYVLEDTVVLYPVQGGNVYFGQMNPEWLDVDKTEIELLGSDSTITSAQIPDTINGLTVAGMSEHAFMDCLYLESVYLPATIDYVWGTCFMGCTNLKEICIADGNPNCYTSDGVLYTKGYNDRTNAEVLSLEYYPATKQDTEFAVPQGVTSIAHYAFADAVNLRSISIPNSVRDIQSGAFGDNYSGVDFTDIYYEGSEEKWKEILVGGDYAYDTIESALIHFNRYEPFAKSIGSDSAWNSVYYDYIIMDRENADYTDAWESVGYELVYLDDDTIPELWITYSSWAEGCRIVSYQDGKITQEHTGSGTLSYEEYGNVFHHSYGHMGLYFDTIFKLENGELVTVAEGRNETTINDDGSQNYDVMNYFWNDVQVSEEVYVQNIDSLVSPAVAKETSDDAQLGYDEILDYLSTLVVAPNEQPVMNQSERKLAVYSDHTGRELSIGSIITLGAVVLSDGNPVGNATEITFQIADPSILSVVSTYDEDQYRYVKFKGLEAGTTNVAFNDSATGSTVVVPITVFEKRVHSYTLSNVPTQQIDKYPTNFYNVNGLYVDSYEYTVNEDQSATISFDVYNTNYSYGTVEVFDENGNLKDAVLIDKMTSSNTGFKEAVLDNLGYLVRDIFQGDLLSYRQESGFSKMTSVCVKVPKNGYITICMDPEESSVVGLVNYADLLLSMLDLTGEITGFSAKSKEFSGKLTAKIVNEKIFAELVSDSDKMTRTLWKNIGKEAVLTPESMGNFVDTAIRNLSEFGLLDVIRSTASDCGWSIGEKVFTDLAGPFGMALKIMFSVGKVENIVIQHHDVTHLAGCGCIVIQNQGGGIRSCQQIKVENEDGFDDDTALNVFSVTLEADVLDLVEKYSPEIYDKMIGGVTYTYNISLMKDGNETQPDGEVTVYIPIPDELKVLAYAGELTDGGLPVNIKIYRIEEDGTLTEMDARVEDGCFVFTTDHFSLYTIVGFDAAEEVQDPELENNNFAVITIAAAIAVAVLLIAVWAKKKKR